jgi:murein DD-endopeptidase MepM/ murein hydrolase activator NlpD
MRGQILVLALVALALFLSAPAEAAVGDVFYGAWSAWSDQLIEYANHLFVETRQIKRPVVRRVWRYSRYALSGDGALRYAARAPGGAFETATFDAPLQPVGGQGAETVYEGQWYNQREQVVVDRIEPVTQYRAREIFTITCALKPASLILSVGEHRKVEVQLLEDGPYSLTSDRPDVAQVDQQGLISAIAPGRARIALIYGAQTVYCDVLVSQGSTGPLEGCVALRLSGTDLTASYAAGAAEVTRLMLSAPGTALAPDPSGCFWVDKWEGGTFSLRALCQPIAYLSAPLGEAGAITGGEAKIEMLREIIALQRQTEAALEGGKSAEAAQAGAWLADVGAAFYRFRAVYTTEDDLILCVQADESYALTASAAAQGARLTIEKLNLSDPRQRWTLAAQDAKVAQGRIWRLPVADNSFCQITDDFKTMARDDDKHDGVDFAPSTDRRVVAVQAGRVVRVDDRCTHDYRKTRRNKYGRYIDPCDGADAASSRYGNYGKYVTIEHEDGVRSMYAHLSEILVKSGQRVEAGQVIGRMGSTGSANGAHLHFEVRVSGRAVDPRYFINFPEVGQYVA